MKWFVCETDFTSSTNKNELDEKLSNSVPSKATRDEIVRYCEEFYSVHRFTSQLSSLFSRNRLAMGVSVASFSFISISIAFVWLTNRRSDNRLIILRIFSGNGVRSLRGQVRRNRVDGWCFRENFVRQCYWPCYMYTPSM